MSKNKAEQQAVITNYTNYEKEVLKYLKDFLLRLDEISKKLDKLPVETATLIRK